MQFSRENISEFIKCSEDPIYFIENYVMVQDPVKGCIPFKLYPYQKRFVNAMMGSDLPVIGDLARQMGKTAMLSSFYLWKAIFKCEQTLIAVSHSAAGAGDIMNRIMFAFGHLPEWMQPGVRAKNKHQLEFDNFSQIIVSGPSSTMCRGRTITHLWVDDGCMQNPALVELLQCTIPCLNIYKDSRITFTGTDIAADAIKLFNLAIVIRASWADHPDRDQSWADNMVSIIGKDAFEREYMTRF